MTEVTQKSNGASPTGMTASTVADQGNEAEHRNAPKRNASQKEKTTPASSSDGATKTPKKRRKVNHACIYCRRSHMTCDLERPCTRCIKRNIAHLCHDEPRESAKKHKPGQESPEGEDDSSRHEVAPPDAPTNTLDQRRNNPDAGLNLAPPPLPQSRVANAAPIAQSAPISAPQAPSLTSNNQSFLNYNDWTPSSQNNFQDMHQFHPSYMFNTSEISNEYNLLNDFLSSSLMDDGTLYGGGDFHNLLSDPSLMNPMGSLTNNSIYNSNTSSSNQLLPPPAQTAPRDAVSRPESNFPTDKAREKYYLTAADPAGSDTPEERLNKLLKAKMDAGLLRPFNYVKGYARLHTYMERNMQPVSRVRILRQLDKFRPKFRERMQSLTDMELVRVEMWFDKSLMEYDRVFASMSIPACCWRRTGEIFRGNREMAELIRVPVKNLRDGHISIHEIIAEGSMVSYWEKFGAIAFDSSQKAILTSCSLKNPDANSKDPEIKCCFSFTIRRDMYNIPALIVGNFLPLLEPTAPES